MNGSTIKTLRKAKAWSQAHLAEVAGVSVRTIQRLEQTGNGADETLLSVAAALDVDVHRLTIVPPQPMPVPHAPKAAVAHPLWQDIPPKQAFRWGLLLLTPSTLFSLSNILKYELDWPHLYDTVVGLGEATGLAHLTGFLLHPAFLLGSAFLASLIALMSQLHITGEDTENGFTIKGVRFSFHHLSTLILLGSILVLGLMLGYAAIENIADWIIELTTG